MVKFLLSFLAILLLNLPTFSQQSIYPKNNYQADFDAAYQQYPAIPKGVLEAVAFTTSRFQHLDNQTESCVGLPAAYGVMGLTLDGKGYFRNNSKLRFATIRNFSKRYFAKSYPKHFGLRKGLQRIVAVS
jgi:hypothetical protein